MPDAPEPGGKKPYVAAAALLILVATYVVLTGVQGRDFGYHWDEYYAQVEPVKRSIIYGTLMPDYYIYPGLNYWINLGTLSPTLVSGALNGEGMTEAGLKLIASPEFVIRLRVVRIILSALCMAWVCLLVWTWKGRAWQGVLAAALIGLSWEVAYHSRWVATDVLVMQFGMLAILCCVSAFQSEKTLRWLLAGAAASALACGMKYPGGAFLIAVLVTAFQVRDKPLGPRGVIVPWLLIGIAFGITFLLTTPGVVLQPWRFFGDLKFILYYYTQHGHRGYTIEPGLAHFVHIVKYLGLTVPSPCLWASGFLSLFALPGLWSMFTRHRALVPLLLLFPLLYLLYFSGQKIFIVRNVLALIPFWALLVSEGVAWVHDKLRPAWSRHVLAGAVVLVLAGNAWWLFDAAQRIQYRYTDRFLREATAYVAGHPKKQYLLSRHMRHAMKRLKIETPANTTTELAKADAFVFFAYDALPKPHIPTRSLTLATKIFGPREVNFRRYPSWQGNNRLLVMTKEQAVAANLDPAELAEHSIKELEDLEE